MIKNFYYKMIELSEFKTLEIQFYLCKMYFMGLDFSINLFSEYKYFQFYLDLYIFKIDLDISRRCNHQGIRFNISLFNVNFDFSKYDIRHYYDEEYDYENLTESK
jgi:hypothetical protein